MLTQSSKTTSSLMNNVKNFAPTDNVVMLVVIITGLIISVYVGYYLYKIFLKTNLETVTLLKSPVKVPKSSVKLINTDTELPVLRNGTEYAYSFWMYLNSFEKNKDSLSAMISDVSNEKADS